MSTYCGGLGGNLLGWQAFVTNKRGAHPGGMPVGGKPGGAPPGKPTGGGLNPGGILRSAMKIDHSIPSWRRHSWRQSPGEPWRHTGWQTWHPWWKSWRRPSICHGSCCHRSSWTTHPRDPRHSHPTSSRYTSSRSSRQSLSFACHRRRAFYLHADNCLSSQDDKT